VREYLAGRQFPIVDEAAATEIGNSLGLSESALRRLLIELNASMSPLVEGIRQDSFDELERTLLALLGEYQAAERERAQACRRRVITAKDHARFALARLEGPAKTDREEMILWMLTWLENPGVFPQWLALRKRARRPTVG
jgi:hypothetical protein